MGFTPFNRNPRPRRDDHVIETSLAEWRLRFYCWRNLLVLSVSTAVAADAILAIVESHPSHALGELTELLKHL